MSLSYPVVSFKMILLGKIECELMDDIGLDFNQITKQNPL